jgi:hypothetical protein
MDRISIAALFRGLLGIGTLGSLAFVASASGPASSPSKGEGDWRLLEPVTYENITVFPVVSAAGADTSAFLTLDEGLASADVLVTEQGSDAMVRSRGNQPMMLPDYNRGSASVNQLVLVNRSKRPLLLLAGEMVSGGKQDRIIGKDRIVPAGAPPLPLDVFCVEHGRWSAGSQFVAAKTIVHPSVREQAAVDQDQNSVWNAVRRGTASARAAEAAPSATLSPQVLNETIATSAPTQSYAKIYESGRVGGSVEEFAAEVQRRFARATAGLKGERVVGVVVAYGAEVAWSDIFASSSLFGHYWSKLLRSYSVEALARPRLRETVSSEEAGQFLRGLTGRETQETDPGVYRWREVTDGQLAQIELDALGPKPLVLHRLFLRRTS